ncbi:MAG TPA: orotidine-5'-phosphate decarboxylase, partial [Candidatus Thermoplasmatota archaeon]|nr:orotidine-5'-phosphate decarboxylase [Candidatus Thermoplasmatota archaeon]
PIILDAKRGDIGNTARAYAKACFDSLSADAVTVAPYMGWDSVEPFARRKGKGVFVLCRTSNPSARDFQDLPVNGAPLYEHVATRVAAWRREHGSELGVVAGATYPAELARVRSLVGEDAPLLIPGVGTQGGSPRDAVTLGGNRRGELAVVNVGRAVANDPKPRAAAEKLRAELNAHRPRSA